MKGVIPLSDTGYIQIRAYAGKAQLPLQDVTVTVSAEDGTVLALRLTDRSGRITPVPIPVPRREESLSPEPGQAPFAKVNLAARLKDYEQVFIRDLQIFPQITTDQSIELIPLPELPASRNKSESFLTLPQNL